MAVKNYNVDPDLNTTIEGINIAEGCPPSGINNAIRQLMADVKKESEAKAEAISAAETQASEELAAFAENQATRDAAQDAAIAEAKSSAETAARELGATKAETDLSNLSAAGRSLAAGLGMPSGRYINLTLGASGTKYTAPANGWGVLHMMYRGSGQFIRISTTNIVSQDSRAGGTQYVYVPVRKGATFQIAYNSSDTTDTVFGFYYAEGAE